MLSYLLRPQLPLPRVGTRQDRDDNNEERSAGRVNLAKAVVARQVVEGVRRLQQEWMQRHAILLSWVNTGLPHTHTNAHTHREESHGLEAKLKTAGLGCMIIKLCIFGAILAFTCFHVARVACVLFMS